MSGRCVGVNSVAGCFSGKQSKRAWGYQKRARESSLCSCTLTGAKSASTIALEEI